MQVITKNGAIFAVTKAHYTPDVEKAIRAGGYTVTTLPDGTDPAQALKKHKSGGKKK